MASEELSMIATESDEPQTASGKVWEWESFWSAFEFSVHSRKIEDIYKMNYLMEPLEGKRKKIAETISNQWINMRNGYRPSKKEIRTSTDTLAARIPHYGTSRQLRSKHNDEVYLILVTQQSNQKWDKFLALQNSGIQEFFGTKTQELEMENDKVWRNSEAKIMHHKDGYYV
ncbi:hypothetical protein TELCIR_19607 [Teladorsagia circumcincta]|uniref:Uncharacterized protein n=1 Tax=Teladorsagia circumcincta TaxID=45464 RepID=A0A2G9TLS6_TELCI|nr:hypothetical protein TELCIR_19607 [Teladorsagia circumcincta]